MGRWAMWGIGFLLAFMVVQTVSAKDKEIASDPASLPALYLADKKGDVTVYSRDKNGKIGPHKASVPEPLSRFDRLTTGKKGRAFLQFRDGGTVEVGPKSDVMVSELESGNDFKARFLLSMGRLKSIVRKLTTPASKYEVEAGGVVAGVRGTQFEVQNDPAKKEVTARTYEGEISTTSGGKTEILRQGFAMAVGEGGKGLLSQLQADDVKEFSEFVSAAGDLEKRKKLLLDQLKKRVLNKVKDKAVNAALEEGGKALGLPF